MKIQKKQPQSKKRWPRYFFIAAAVMVLIAVVLYFWMYASIDREFSAMSSFYGEHYEELFKLQTPDKDVAEEIMGQAEAAFAFIGSEKDCESFGTLGRYCAKTEYFPEAAKAEFELEQLAGKTGESEGYLWIAYTYGLYDANGELISASGSENQRILARWSIEKINGCWQVTEILEHP